MTTDEIAPTQSESAKSDSGKTSPSVLKRLVKILVFVVVGLVGISVAAKLFLSNPMPTNRQSGPEADQLARRVQSAVGAKAWPKVGAISWTFAGRNQHIWDRQRECAQVTTGDLVVKLHIPTKSGSATRSGQPLTGAPLEHALKRAYSAWINDRFWLNPFETFFDDGVLREKVDENRLLITYGHGGVTPGDSYLWILDKDGRPTEWQMWVSIIPIDGLSTSWENWKSFDGMFISTSHKIGGLLPLKLTNVKVAGTVTELCDGDDPFKSLAAIQTKTSSPTPNKPDRPEPTTKPSKR